MALPNKLKCTFCFTPTGFTEGGKSYCIDCWVKILTARAGVVPKPFTSFPSVSPVPFTPLPNMPYFTTTVPSTTTSTIIG